jgi:hypothetical protein
MELVQICDLHIYLERELEAKSEAKMAETEELVDVPFYCYAICGILV